MQIRVLKPEIDDSGAEAMLVHHINIKCEYSNGEMMSPEAKDWHLLHNDTE